MSFPKAMHKARASEQKREDGEGECLKQRRREEERGRRRAEGGLGGRKAQRWSAVCTAGLSAERSGPAQGSHTQRCWLGMLLS